MAWTLDSNVKHIGSTAALRLDFFNRKNLVYTSQTRIHVWLPLARVSSAAGGRACLSEWVLSLERTVGPAAGGRFSIAEVTHDGRYLVDPASSHMLVSKIKPCMSQYKHVMSKLQTAH